MKTTDDFLSKYRAEGSVFGPDEEEAREYLAKHAKPTKKGHGWWIEPHNLLANQALMGMNLWRFRYDASVGQGGDGADGVIIRPMWDSLRHGDTVGQKDFGGFSHLTMADAKQVVKMMKSQPSVAKTTADELDDAEKKAGKKIPASIRAKILKGAPKVAARRWGVDRLKIKKQFIPFDGSKPYNLSNWG